MPMRTSSRAITPLSDIACQACGKIFHPAERVTKYCSRACFAHSERVKAAGRQKSFEQNDILHRSIPVTETGCYLWEGLATNRGYGQIKRNGKTYSAHRVSWLVFRGSIPEGMEVMHKCDTPLCVNPDHMRLGTHQENIADRDQKGRLLIWRRTGRRVAAQRKRNH